MTCPWSIRWTTGQDASCDKPEHVHNLVITHTPAGQFTVDYQGDGEHHAVIRDYAYPGSETKLNWKAGDRREFTGDWPGPCTKLTHCTFHAGHHGRCAL
jgi:hypothetical protein